MTGSNFLSSIDGIDEINFWLSSGGQLFRILNPSESFLFSRKSQTKTLPLLTICENLCPNLIRVSSWASWLQGEGYVGLGFLSWENNGCSKIGNLSEHHFYFRRLIMDQEQT